MQQDVDMQQAQRIVPWLAKHGALIGSLELYLPNSPKDPYEGESSEDYAARTAEAEDVEAAIAAALQQAAAPPSGLQLQHCTIFTPRAAVLQQLSNSGLTSMKLYGSVRSLGQAEQLQHVAAALADLTGLQRLELEYFTGVGPLFPGLGALSWLTHLEVSCLVYDVAAFQQSLPSQLHKLVVKFSSNASAERASEGRQLQLGHLTALTEITTSTDPDCELPGMIVCVADVMPPNLVVLHVTDCYSTHPMLQLHSLRQLAIDDSTTSAHGLQQLSSLSALSKLDLTYYSWASAAAAAAAWQLLPLQVLRIYAYHDIDTYEASAAIAPAAAAVLQQLGKAASLTNLFLQANRCEWPVACQQLAAALQQLKSLQSLTLWRSWGPGIEQLDQADEAGEGSTSAAVMQAAAGLPQLQTLDLMYVPFDCAAAEQLAAATQLTELHIFDCVDKLARRRLRSLALGLTGLASLNIFP